MEIDFLVARSPVQRRHNISPIEVKSAGEYATRSLDKFITKYGQTLGTAYVLHPKNIKREQGKLFLPVYMAGLLGTEGSQCSD